VRVQIERPERRFESTDARRRRRRRAIVRRCDVRAHFLFDARPARARVRSRERADDERRDTRERFYLRERFDTGPSGPVGRDGRARRGDVDLVAKCRCV